MLDVSLDKVRHAVLVVLAFVIATAFHEFGHAWMASRLGDPTPGNDGRLTLSPRAHVDKLGTLLFPALGALFGWPLIAWGRPVRTQPAYYRGRWRGRSGHMLVAFAGPAMNVALALVVSLLLGALGAFGLVPLWLAVQIFSYAITLNIFLFVFNLIPLPPLDGAAVADGFLPPTLWATPRALLRQWGPVILFLLLMTGLLGHLLVPAVWLSELWFRTLFGIMGMVP